MRANPKKLNPLQLKTLALLQAIAKEADFADPPQADGSIMLRRLPHAHGDHFHIGGQVVASRDATGLGNPNVWNALVRKGLILTGEGNLPVLTAEAQAYETGLGQTLLQGGDH